MDEVTIEKSLLIPFREIKVGIPARLLAPPSFLFS